MGAQRPGEEGEGFVSTSGICERTWGCMGVRKDIGYMLLQRENESAGIFESTRGHKGKE